MNKNLIIALVSVAVLGGLALVLTTNKSNPSPTAETTETTETTTNSTSTDTTPPANPTEPTNPSNPPADSKTVSYNGRSFNPSTIEVAVGTTVVFKNESDAQVWPASDPHPIHTGLRGFDSNGGLSNGQTYSFTFSKAGTFRYHNHLSPEEDGTVVVK